MAVTFDLTSDQLAQGLAKQAFAEIEKRIHDELAKRVQPIIDEAAREVAKGIKPAILHISRDPMSGDIHVKLVINYQEEKVA